MMFFPWDKTKCFELACVKLFVQGLKKSGPAAQFSWEISHTAKGSECCGWIIITSLFLLLISLLCSYTTLQKKSVFFSGQNMHLNKQDKQVCLFSEYIYWIKIIFYRVFQAQILYNLARFMIKITTKKQ